MQKWITKSDYTRAKVILNIRDSIKKKEKENNWFWKKSECKFKFVIKLKAIKYLRDFLCYLSLF